MTPEERMAAYRRALRPANGTCTDADLDALGSWARPRDPSQRRAWASRVRELLAESPGRDLASAAIQARGDGVGMGPRSNETGPRSDVRRWAGDVDANGRGRAA